MWRRVASQSPDQSNAPTAMNMDPAQQMIFKIFPFFFLILLYTFPSGLVLYWTVQNCLSIGQQMLTNRMKDDFEIAVPISDASDLETKKSTTLAPKKNTKKRKKR